MSKVLFYAIFAFSLAIYILLLRLVHRLLFPRELMKRLALALEKIPRFKLMMRVGTSRRQRGRKRGGSLLSVIGELVVAGIEPAFLLPRLSC